MIDLYPHLLPQKTENVIHITKRYSWTGRWRFWESFDRAHLLLKWKKEADWKTKELETFDSCNGRKWDTEDQRASSHCDRYVSTLLRCYLSTDEVMIASLLLTQEHNICVKRSRESPSEDTEILWAYRIVPAKLHAHRRPQHEDKLAQIQNPRELQIQSHWRSTWDPCRPFPLWHLGV